MFDKLKLIARKYDDINEKMADPKIYNDPSAVARLLREQKEIIPVVEAFRRYEKAVSDMQEARRLLGEKIDPDFREMVQEEFQKAKDDIERLEQELKILLLPTDPNDSRNVIIEIRGGAGGEEAVYIPFR